MTPPQNTADITDPRDAQRAENIEAGRVPNHKVPGWDAKADDAEGIELVCPNPDCGETLDTRDGIATTVCPYCATYYTAPTSGFGHDVIRDANFAANREDPNRDNFETVGAAQARSQATERTDVRPEAKAKAAPAPKVTSPGAEGSVKL